MGSIREGEGVMHYDHASVVYAVPAVLKIRYPTMRRWHRRDAHGNAPLPIAARKLPKRVTKSIVPIVRLVEQIFMVRFDMLFPESRRIARAQHRLALSALYWACRTFTGLTTTQIARAFDRDHTSIVQTCRVVQVAAMLQQETIPADDALSSLLWIRARVRRLPSTKEVKDLRRHFRMQS